MAEEQENYTGPERRAGNGWHVDKRVSVSHLITTVLLSVSLIKWGMVMEARMAQREIFEQAQAQRDVAQDRMIERFDGNLSGQIEKVDTKLSARLDRIDDKLDRLIEGATDRRGL